MRSFTFFAWSITLQCGCAASPESQQAPAPSNGAIATISRPTPEVRLGYPHARWRLASANEQKRATIWLSHILVRFDTAGVNAPLRRHGWRPDPPNPSRTKTVALQRAVEVADLAAKPGSDFRRLAKQYSDDVVTGDIGGLLGAMTLFEAPKEYIDAASALKVGETSKAFETPAGYAIIRRDPTPPSIWVSGRHILIRYASTLAQTAQQSNATRTHDDAAALAWKLAREAQREPIKFDSLRLKYSDDPDTNRGGAIGTWNTLAPGPVPKRTQQLALTPPGEVTDPIDSPFGFEVILRTTDAPSDTYAMQILGIPVAPDTRAAAKAEIESLARSLRRDPGSFDKFRLQRCCELSEVWTVGQVPSAVAAAVSELKIGEIARKPIEVPDLFILPRRIDPASATQPPARVFDIPEPEAPDYLGLISTNEGAPLAREARQLSEEVRRALRLDPDRDKKVWDLLETLAKRFGEKDVTPEERVQAWKSTNTHISTVLGATDFNALQTVLNIIVTRRILEAS
jgi:hypothetical protein